MTRPRSFSRLLPGAGELSAGEFNRMAETVERSANPVGKGVHVDSTGIGYQDPEPEWVYAKLTEKDLSSGTPLYSWKEVLPKGDGTFDDDYIGVEFSYVDYPAYEANGAEVEPPHYTIIYKGDGNWVYFFASGGGGRRFFPARIDGSDCPNGTFDWTEMKAIEGGGWEVLENGRTSAKDGLAYHLNRQNFSSGGPLVAAGTIVWMTEGYYSPDTQVQEYVFDCPAGWSGTESYPGRVECAGNPPRLRVLPYYKTYWNGQLIQQPCHTTIYPCDSCPPEPPPPP